MRQRVLLLHYIFSGYVFSQWSVINAYPYSVITIWGERWRKITSYYYLARAWVCNFCERHAGHPFFCASITSHFYTSNFKHSYENVQILSKMSNFVQNVQFCPVCPIVQICSIYSKLLRLKVSILFFFFWGLDYSSEWVIMNTPKKFLVHCPNKKCTKHAQQKIIAVSTCIRSTVFENRSKMSRAKRLFTISICCVDEVLPNISFNFAKHFLIS